MSASLIRWMKSAAVAGALAAVVPGTASAGWWDWWRPAAPQPAIPVGPPIYSPAAPQVVNYQGGVVVPSNPVPAALPPTLNATPAPAAAYAAPTVVAQPGACATCAVAPQVSNYVPPSYRTNWVQVPVTTYRPVASVDPRTGLPINAVAPCTTTMWQARRVPNSLWGGLWPATTAPPTVVAYTPATIAAYPGVRVTQYAPPPVYLAPQVTQYAPAPAPVVTNYAQQPYVSPPPATTVAPPAAHPSDCPPAAAPPASYPPTSYPPASSGSVVPRTGTSVPADIPPSLNNGTTTRSYPPLRDYDNERLVPIERRRIESAPPEDTGPELQSPRGSQSESSPERGSSSWIPFTRPEKAASSPAPSRNLRLVPDPDAERLDLRKHEIPNLIQPGDRSTQRITPRSYAGKAITWPEKEEVRPTPVRAIPASIPSRPLDDSGWRSVP